MSRRSGTSRASSRSHLPDEAQQEIREIFEIFDSDKSGSIDRHELKICLRSMGFDFGKPEIDAIMKEKDPNNLGFLDFRAFSEVIAEKTSQRKPEDEYRKVFSLFDSQNTGRIGINDLRRVVSESNENLTEDQMKSMIAQFDSDGDGYISLEEFIKIMDPSA